MFFRIHFETFCFIKIDMSIDYKFEDNDRKLIIYEFLAHESVVHKIDNKVKKEVHISNDINVASEYLAQGMDVERTIEWVQLFVNYYWQLKKYSEIDLILQSNLLGFILPYANIETEYSTLNTTLKILYRLSCFEQNENSSFLNIEFAGNIIEILHKAEKYPTIRKMSLKLVNKLIKNEIFGINIFQNLIHCEIIPAILSSNIIKQDNFIETKGKNFKVVAKTAELLGNLASYCIEDVSIFSSFFEIIFFYISNKFSDVDEKELILCNFLYLLSFMMMHDANRKLAYSFQVPDIIIDNVLSRKKDIFIKYSYDIFYHMINNDIENYDLLQFFQTDKFYNITRSAIQEVNNQKSLSVAISILNAVGALIPYNYKGLYENSIISEVFDVFYADLYKFKNEALLLLLRFFHIISKDSAFCIYVLQNSNYFQQICLDIEAFPKKRMMYLFDVIKSLIDWHSGELSEEIQNCNEAFDALASLSTFEDNEIASAANELLSFWQSD